MGVAIGAVCVVIFVIATLILGMAWLSRAIGRSHWLTRRYANLTYAEEKCKRCTMGTQYLHPDTGWGPIPEHLHGVRKGSKYLGSRQANVRPCTSCNATGRVPVSIPGILDQGHVRYIP